MSKPKSRSPLSTVLQPTPISQQLLHRFQSDCAAVSNPDISTPFLNAEDAVHRLLPFHLLASEDEDEADIDETQDGQGSNLLCSRRDLWRDLCFKKSMEVHAKITQLRERLDKFESKLSEPERPRPEEEYALQQICLEEAHRWKAGQQTARTS
uniref:GLTSCR protein conserved domain-containing protein n=2 Tax=Tetraselmis sp. GSL018 TaxID=582737 RepID=A0A061R425_9CHLO|mmetsp:Transcript_611/g.1470  ORF Transcript_611/g.1470 Transcript_611/m.1470 type:complete len:153 (+) Transcript_611:87-545(+)